MLHWLSILVIAVMAIPGAHAQISANDLPPVDAAGKTYFQQRFLVHGFHRAFAVSPTGDWGAWLGSTSSLDRARDEALSSCLKKSNKPCTLYALDGYIVAGKDISAIPRYADAPRFGRILPSDYYPVRGPATAKGLVIWSHGYFRGIDATQGQPQGYVSRFHNAGWDVYRYNREWVDQLHTDIQGLIDAVAAAKAAGYTRVVLTGQSQGGWISLASLGRGVKADGVVAISPAAHGEPPGREARQDFRGLMSDIKSRNTADIPLVIAFFNDDGYDPGGRNIDVRGILGDTQVPLYLIDHPAELKGHGAGNSVAFNDRFGPCIVSWITEKTQRDCK